MNFLPAVRDAGYSIPATVIRNSLYRLYYLFFGVEASFLIIVVWGHLTKRVKE